MTTFATVTLGSSEDGWGDEKNLSHKSKGPAHDFNVPSGEWLWEGCVCIIWCHSGCRLKLSNLLKYIIRQELCYAQHSIVFVGVDLSFCCSLQQPPSQLPWDTCRGADPACYGCGIDRSFLNGQFLAAADREVV